MQAFFQERADSFDLEKPPSIDGSVQSRSFKADLQKPPDNAPLNGRRTNARHRIGSTPSGLPSICAKGLPNAAMHRSAVFDNRYPLHRQTVCLRVSHARFVVLTQQLLGFLQRFCVLRLQIFQSIRGTFE